MRPGIMKATEASWRSEMQYGDSLCKALKTNNKNLN